MSFPGKFAEGGLIVQMMFLLEEVSKTVWNVVVMVDIVGEIGIFIRLIKSATICGFSDKYVYIFRTIKIFKPLNKIFKFFMKFFI